MLVGASAVVTAGAAWDKWGICGGSNVEGGRSPQHGDIDET